MNVIMLGKAGSGKGTHSDILAEKTGLTHISSGDLLRAEAKKGSELGNEIQKIIDKGDLVPDEMMISLIKNKIENAEKGVVLDGFPRNLEQAKKLEEMVDIGKVILMDVTDDEVIKRLSSRRQCKKCGKIYSMIYFPPKKEDVCDECGGELYTRDDDKPEAIKKRLDIFHKEVEPLIDYYDEKGILRRVDCDGEVAEVAGRVEEAFNS